MEKHFLALWLATGVSLAGCGRMGQTETQPSKTGNVLFGVVGKSATTWPLFVALRKGFFAANGLQVEVIVTGASANTAQQLAAGSLNLGESGLPDFIRAIQAGAPMEIVSGAVATPPYSLLVKPEIKTWKDLRGKTFIIGGPKDVTRIFFEAMAMPNGLRDGDYELSYAGATANRMAALRSGSVDGAILFPPFDSLAEAQGFKNMGRVQDYLKSFPFTGYAANAAWARGHPEELVAFFRANFKAIDWLYDSGSKDEAVQILAQETNTQPENASRTYDLFFKEINAYRRDGIIPDEGLSQVLESLVKLGDLQEPLPPLDKFFNPTYVRAAVQER
ncbi:MAG: ABC transporter substrate-binding protein [Acidobacteria bacterium]|nr:ABC transporter substrate-binding protein [Acidobacteriota bacterium]